MIKRMLKKLSVLSAVLAVLVLPAVASAHVVVKPAEVLTGSFLTYTMGAPNEKDVAVTMLKLEIPAGLQYVQPTVKPGWTITTEKTGEGLDAVVKSITWEGGSIEAGFRDDFTFSAKAPDNVTKLNWKAYQTYADGVTVAWDQKPSTDEKESETTGPYSITSVVKTATANAVTANVASTDSDTDNTPKYLSIAALVVSVLAFAIVTRPQKKR